MSINIPSNVVEFKPTTKQNIQVENTKNQVNEIMSEKNQKYSKWDIIWALLNINNDSLDNLDEDYLLNMDYKKLLKYLYTWICAEIWLFYNQDELDLIYDENNLSIYVSDIYTKKRYAKLDVTLIPNEDFSEVHIVISHKWNEMFFFKNIKDCWKTNYLPIEAQIKVIQEEFIETNVANDESQYNQHKKYHRIMSKVLLTHFPDFIDLHLDEFESINNMTNDDLSIKIIEMTFLRLKDTFDLKVHKENQYYLERKIIKDDQVFFENIEVGFDTSGNTQNIYLLNSNWEIFAEIVK